MDGTDKKIIELLQQDGRLEDVEIARKIGISHDTVKLGYTSVFILGITLAPGMNENKNTQYFISFRIIKL